MYKSAYLRTFTHFGHLSYCFIFSHIFSNFSGKSGKISGKFLCFTIEQFCQTLHFALCIFDLDMSASVKSYTYVGMTHYILQRFWIHSAFSHIRAESVSADVRRDLWQGLTVDLIILLSDIVHIFLPVKCNKRLAVFVKIQEP